MAIQSQDHVSAADKEYKLPRDGRESIRLTAQHYMVVNRQGWILHPDVESAIKDIPNPKIIDLATGTGVYDSLDEVPEEHREKYDLVHVRLLLSAGPSIDKLVFIECFKKFLKPGGWLQWEELAYPNILSVHVDANSPSGLRQDFSVAYPIVHLLEKHLKMSDRLGWIDQFEKIVCKAGGWETAQKIAVPVHPHLLKIETDLTAVVLMDLTEKMIMIKRLKDQHDLTEFSEAIRKLHEDQDNGVMFAYNWVCGIAKKS